MGKAKAPEIVDTSGKKTAIEPEKKLSSQTDDREVAGLKAAISELRSERRTQREQMEILLAQVEDLKKAKTEQTQEVVNDLAGLEEKFTSWVDSQTAALKEALGVQAAEIAGLKDSNFKSKFENVAIRRKLKPKFYSVAQTMIDRNQPIVEQFQQIAEKMPEFFETTEPPKTQRANSGAQLDHDGKIIIQEHHRAVLRKAPRAMTEKWLTEESYAKVHAQVVEKYRLKAALAGVQIGGMEAKNE